MLVIPPGWKNNGSVSAAGFVHNEQNDGEITHNRFVSFHSRLATAVPVRTPNVSVRQTDAVHTHGKPRTVTMSW